MTCSDAERVIGRYADDPDALAAPDRTALDRHLAGCEACRIGVDDQRTVARLLGSRPIETVRPGFAARLTVRLDAEPQGILALANWRAWTATLAPLAAALVFVAWSGTASTTTVTAPAVPAAAAPETFAAWTEANAGAGRAAVFLQQSTSDVLLESVLTGTIATAGGSDGR